MTTTQQLLSQMEQEAETTRKMLAIIPDDKLDWQPHPKSMTLRRLAGHVAELPGWVEMAINTSELDLSQLTGEKPAYKSHTEIQEFFEQELAKGRTAMQGITDKDLTPDWTLRHGDHVISVRPKEDIVRMTISQTIHHRAQLGVFLRLLDVPIPGSYGPSADEMGR